MKTVKNQNLKSLAYRNQADKPGRVEVILCQNFPKLKLPFAI